MKTIFGLLILASSIRDPPQQYYSFTFDRDRSLHVITVNELTAATRIVGVEAGTLMAGKSYTLRWDGVNKDWHIQMPIAPLPDCWPCPKGSLTK